MRPRESREKIRAGDYLYRGCRVTKMEWMLPLSTEWSAVRDGKEIANGDTMKDAMLGVDAVLAGECKHEYTTFSLENGCDTCNECGKDMLEKVDRKADAMGKKEVA